MTFGLIMAEIKDDNDDDIDNNHKPSWDSETMLMMKHRGIDTISIEEYVYRGEGNANLVIALSSARSVLRFRKIKSTNDVPIDGGKSRVEFELKFFKHYISKYLGSFVNQPEIFRCHPRDIPDWDRLVESYRPSHRRHKSVYEEYATKLPDYSLLPAYLEDKSNKKSTLCIEIKPKQGFVPEGDRLLQKCSYCVNQFYKITEKKIIQRSHYCPCDLFSGDMSRLRRAIDALIESPQNNFIVFKNGFHTWGEGCEHKDLERVLNDWFSNNSLTDTKQHFEDLNYLICQALLRKFHVNENNYPLMLDPFKLIEITAMRKNERYLNSDTIHDARINLCHLDETCDFSMSNLPQGSVLDRILRMQQLHQTSADVIHSIYSAYSSVLNEHSVYFSKPEEVELRTDVDNRGSIFISDEITLLRNYLLFCIAKDCSILLTFREINLDSVEDIPADNIILLPQQQRHFVFNVRITDVDSKKLNRIEKHRQRTIRALNSITIDSKKGK